MHTSDAAKLSPKSVDQNLFTCDWSKSSSSREHTKFTWNSSWGFVGPTGPNRVHPNGNLTAYGSSHAPFLSSNTQIASRQSPPIKSITVWSSIWGKLKSWRWGHRLKSSGTRMLFSDTGIPSTDHTLGRQRSFTPSMLLTFRPTSNPLLSLVLLRVVRVNCRFIPFKPSFSKSRWSHNDASEPSSSNAYVSMTRPLHRPWTRTGVTRRQTRFLPPPSMPFDAVADAWCKTTLWSTSLLSRALSGGCSKVWCFLTQPDLSHALTVAHPFA